MFWGLLDTITSTEESKDCPGVCVHALATVICYEVLENVSCSKPAMKCCIETPSGEGNVTKVPSNPPTTETTKPVKTLQASMLCVFGIYGHVLIFINFYCYYSHYYYYYYCRLHNHPQETMKVLKNLI